MSFEPERNLLVRISQKDCRRLSSNQWQLQVAKSVIVKGELQFNTIWRSTSLAPTMDIAWATQYGFNWTSVIPTEGVTVRCGGEWAACGLGQVLDVDSDGYFGPSAAKPDAAYMKVGANKYRSQNPDGIHIVVGVMGPSGSYEPIFVDPTPIGINMSATYQPQEKLQWWYESGIKTATIFDDHETPFGNGDFSAPDPATGTFKMVSEYDYTNGEWITSSVACEFEVA